ncbi:MAG TPA: hypothetical protein IGS53_16555 [Leptolyngbyaceae cyanobacterium M33_DOE_097]|uniref:Pepco domain-containing protein n=1 Tax=Oscillatoriales cyanobacterium SpSt-418 TaxID=2282169 RepID=A0A7C3PPD1_9CYAN|nr:hypothetical protein [Leptolyngbyaceae cyanobacterium M33_DOE_097]
MPEDIIWIVTQDQPISVARGEKGWGSGDLSPSFQRTPVDFATLQQEWNKTLSQVGQLIQQAEQRANLTSQLQLDEVTLAIEISGKGQVSLLGVGGEASSRGSITLKYKRVEIRQAE